MSMLVVPSLYVLAGIFAHAAFNHLTVGRRPVDRVRLLFAALCLLTALFALSHAYVLQATDAGEFVWALRGNLAVALLFLLLFLWFIALYAGQRPWLLLTGLSALFAVLFVANLTAPYTMQYDRFDGIRTLVLPWGETVTRGVGHNGAWAYLVIAGVALIFGYALHALGGLYRRERRRGVLCMLFAIGLFLVSVIQGILVRLSVIDFVELGPFGYLALVLVMSAALTYETRQRLRASERRFRSLVEQSPFSIQILTPDGRTRRVNPAWERLWGIKAEDLAPYNILHDRQLVEKGIMPYIEKGFAGEATEIPPIVYNPADNPVVTGPVRDRWVRAHIYPIKDERGRIDGIVLMHEDVTEKKRIEDAIRLIASGVSAATGEHFFRQMVQSLARLFDADYAFIGVLDERDTQRVNTLAVFAHGEIAADISYALAGTPCANVMGQTTCAYPRGVQQLFPQDRLLAEMGVEGYIGTPLFDADGQALGIMALLDGKPLESTDQLREIMEIFAARAGAELQRLRAEMQMWRMAYYDYLTGLASRAQLHEHLSETLRRTRLSHGGGALLLIDLDHFKTINDALGHDVGDEVLRAVARRLHEAASERVFVARFGGDEFVALLDASTSNTPETEEAVRGLAQKIVEKLSSPIFVGERAFTIGVSIGVALFPENGETELDIVRHADMALHRAKNLGRGNIQFYSPNLQLVAANRLQMEDGLRRAVGNGELDLYFQPQLDVAGRILGAEALLRWHHPELGDIPPATFIPIAEETGLIHTIGRWVFDQACERITAWRRLGALFTGHLSINVYPWQFARPDFIEQLRHSLAKYRVDPGRLMLEMTETALLHDLEETIEKLAALRALGLKVALDDFGTGYSSLAYLRDLPLDQIKIDQAFVCELDSAIEHPLIESMIAIGRHMKLPVVAEGVETEIQRDILIKLGCECFQGFLFCRPIPEKEFLTWLGNH